MSFKVIIRPEAETDISQQFDWYEARKQGLGYEFLIEIRSVLLRIEQNPLGHAEIYKKARRSLVRRFPLKVFYLVEAETVEVIGVIHARRDPQYWRRRVPIK